MEQNISHPNANMMGVNQSTQGEWAEINVLHLVLKVGSQYPSLSELLMAMTELTL